MNVKLYIAGTGVYLDLFQDEVIELNDSVQNISDITKVFTPYTQSFTIPASPTNNAVFKHWYNQLIINGFDAQQGVDGWIELNSEIFRIGKFKLEKANLKDNLISNYSISFTSEVANIKDIFGEAKLKDLTALDNFGNFFPYNETTVRGVINGTISDLYFPIISNKNVWTFGDAGAFDISTANKIKWNELFPSVSFSLVLDCILNQFDTGIDIIDTDIIGSDLLKKTHLLFKNRELSSNGTISVFSNRKLAVLNTGFGPFTDIANDKFSVPLVDQTNYLNYISLGAFDTPIAFISSSVGITVQMTSMIGNWIAELWKDGQFYQSLQSSGTNTVTFSGVSDAEYQVYVKTEINQAITYNIECDLGVKYKKENSLNIIVINNDITFNGATGGITSVSNLPLTQLAPDIKVIDFFKSVLTMMNGTLTKQDGKIVMKTLDTWIYEGDIIDVTEQIDVKSKDISRPKLPKVINFEKLESKSIVNTNFFEVVGTKHGDLKAEFNYDGSDLSFKLPFETPIPFELSNDIVTMYLFDKELKPYIPKGLMLTYADQVATPNIYLGATALTSYYPVSTTTIDDLAINWGAEIENQTGVTSLNSLYEVWYRPYIENLYNAQSRMLSIDGFFNQKTVKMFSLNDRVGVDGILYTINDYKLDLTTGKIKLNLLSDFRPLPEIQLYEIDNSAQTVTPTIGLVGLQTYTESVWKGNQPMHGVTNQDIEENLTIKKRQGYYLIYIKEGYKIVRVIKVIVIQDGQPTEPINAKITTDGTAKFTTDNQYKVTA